MPIDQSDRSIHLNHVPSGSRRHSGTRSLRQKSLNSTRFPPPIGTSRRPRHALTTILAAGAIALLLPRSSTAALKVQAKECIACHAPVQKEEAKKVVHAPFKDLKNCESCHKRHGVVGTLVLKEPEPGLC